MFPYNFHTHSRFDDGKNSPEDYVKEAVKKEFKALGFSGHAPLPSNPVWCIDNNQIFNYLKEINSLKEKYQNILEIYSGLEADFIEGIVCPKTTAEKYNTDYIIGSIHFIKYGNEIFEIDGTFENFENGFLRLLKGNAKALVEIYTKNCLEMINNHTPDIIAHFDKIKLYLSKFLPNLESQNWYMENMSEIVAASGKKDLIMEVNTRGLYKGYCKETYPSKKLLKLMNETKIRISLNSDAHAPSEIDAGYKTSLKLLKDVGFKHIWVLKNHQWQAVKIK